MRTKARRGTHALTMAVLTAVVCLTGRVEAQQSGLFPLAPIRRQRVPCDREDPTYKIYKQQYFGYHPTCWRTFPAGWGAPSSEGPNRAKSLKDHPIGSNRELDEDFGPGADDRLNPGAGLGAPRQRQSILSPRLPTDDPFNDPGAGAPGVNPLPPRDTPRRPATPLPDATKPFDDFNRPGASLSPSGTRPQPRSGATDPAPELTAPSGQPAQGSASRSSRDDGDTVLTASGDDEPLLGLADAELARSDEAGSPNDPQSGASASPAAGPSTGVESSPPATPAKPRRRLFGNLFSGLGAGWNRQ
jgi:hypothetical protein